MVQMRAKIPLIEQMGVRCFPNSQMLWLFDDKIRETFFLQKNDYPTPKTFISFCPKEASKFLDDTEYPIVAKSHIGASSGGVVLLKDKKEAARLVRRSFRTLTLWDKVLAKYYYLPRLAKGDPVSQLRFAHRRAWPQYVYFQEFIATSFDWRVTTFGDGLVSAFVRNNRPGDFRASGSGSWNMVDERELPVEACELAMKISSAHGFTTMTYDFMPSKAAGWLIGEMSFGFLLNDVYSNTLFRRCSGGYAKVPPIRCGALILNSIINSLKETAAPVRLQALAQLV
jgi:glutathione synthase/RimK-type ligase-like ATP-grasp enzyme